MSEELKIIDNIRKKGFRPQVVGCFINNHKILFLYKKKHKLWQLPQGGIDNKETIRKALKREMTEELGEDFVKNCNFDDVIIVKEAQLEFSPKFQGSRELKTDSDRKMRMKGKRYLFIEIQAETIELNVKQTEFDEYKWCTLKEALSLVNNIYQIGKKQTTLKAIKSLQIK